MPTTWKKLESEMVLQNKWYSIRRDKVMRPDGKEGEYYVLQQTDSIYLLAWHSDKLIMVRQYRYPTGIESWEIPAGGSEAGETVLSAAARELQEETGLVASKLEVIGTFQELSARSTGMGHVVWCETLSDTDGAQHEEEGIIAQAAFSWTEIVGMIKDGSISDSGTLSALMIARTHELL